jgi:hypothetical protein
MIDNVIERAAHAPVYFRPVEVRFVSKNMIDSLFNLPGLYDGGWAKHRAIT